MSFDRDKSDIWTYRHHNQPTSEEGIWKARAHESTPIVDNIDKATKLWDTGVEEFLRKRRDGEHDAFEMDHRPLTNGDNTCWMNAVLQSILSILVDLKDTPAVLEVGTTEIAHSIFLCSFGELAFTSR
jgi:hypothetical protein